MEKIKDWNSKTNQQRLTWGQAQIACRATIGRTLQYSLPATTFDEADCKELQNVYLQTMLGKTGVVRTAPHIIAIAPPWLGGFGLMSFEVEQFISHLGIILQHGQQTRCVIHYTENMGLPPDQSNEEIQG